MVFIYLLAFILLVGGWIWFIYLKEKEKQYSILIVVSMSSPFLLFSVAIKLAENTGSNSAIFSSYSLLMILIANSILLNLTIFLVSLKKK
ncbi:hypothetical protein CEH05_16650 [Halobacillus halophilus]|uniref:hypothetical protein n=1 Tax=Halobacillus halophilus TaxID=1570 RepID=UPI00059FB01C|nr:hypothetical protein [Halobacillus halophilus]ASF40693.1 hypothetical protein CEH05_16650 [Halobacillus halophilus]